MKLSTFDKTVIFATTIGISMLAWALLFIKPTEIFVNSLCDVSSILPSRASFQIFLLMNPFDNFFMGWVVMVIAMMLPKLIMPIKYINVKSLKRNRLLLSILFATSYMLVWIMVGLVMVTIILLSNWILPASNLPAIIVGVLSIIWQFSPMKQKFLNLGHTHLPISAFGIEAYADVITFGMKHGIWCVGSGWAIMLFPMLLHEGHNIAMLCVSFIMLSEHLDHPKAPQWRFTFRLVLIKYLYMQTILHIKRLNNSINTLSHGSYKRQNYFLRN